MMGAMSRINEASQQVGNIISEIEAIASPPVLTDDSKVCTCHLMKHLGYIVDDKLQGSRHIGSHRDHICRPSPRFPMTSGSLQKMPRNPTHRRVHMRTRQSAAAGR